MYRGVARPREPEQGPSTFEKGAVKELVPPPGLGREYTKCTWNTYVYIFMHPRAAHTDTA